MGGLTAGGEIRAGCQSNTRGLGRELVEDGELRQGGGRAQRNGQWGRRGASNTSRGEGVRFGQDH